MPSKEVRAFPSWCRQIPMPRQDSPLPLPPASLTISPNCLLLKGCTKTFKHHAVTGAFHPDLFIQDPEKTPSSLSSSSSWQVGLVGDSVCAESQVWTFFLAHGTEHAGWVLRPCSASTPLSVLKPSTLCKGSESFLLPCSTPV